MRFNKTLLSLSGLFTLSLTNSFKDPICNSINTLTSFSNNSSPDIQLKVGLPMYTDHRITASLYNASTDAKVYTKTYTKRDYTPSSDGFTLTANLPIKGRLNSYGVRIEFVHMISGEVRHTNSGVIYPLTEESININAYRNEPFIKRGTYLKIENYKFYTDESYDFSDMNDYLSVNSNNALDFSSVNFVYDAYGEFFSGDIYLNIRDYRNIFPNLKKNNDVISIKMKSAQNNNVISLDINETMYVNKNTLDMYSQMSSNCEATKSLFIPIGKEEELSENDIYITMHDVSYGLTDFTIPFNFYYSRNYFGECFDSDYCIHGGVRE